MRKNPYRWDAYQIYLFFTAAFAFIASLLGTVLFVYFATEVTDDPFQLVLIGSVFQGTIILFEIPTGVVADIYSRRLSIWIGLVVGGIGITVQGLLPLYGAVLFAQFLSGIGKTFISGATEAWIADEIGEERVGQAYLRAAQIRQAMRLAAIPVSTVLATMALTLPIILAGVLLILLAVVLMAIMPEEGFQRKPAEERDSWRALFKTFGDGIRLVRRRSVLIVIMVISLIYGLSSCGFDNLWEVNLLALDRFPVVGHFEPIVWFGFVRGIASILGLMGTEMVRRTVDVRRQAAIVRALMILTGMTAVSMVVFGLSQSFWLAVVAYWAQLTLRVAGDPIMLTWINQNVESSVRATVLSMNTQVNSLGQITGGPLIGAIGSTVSLPVALISSGLARIPVSLLFVRLLFQGKQNQMETVAEPERTIR